MTFFEITQLLEQGKKVKNTDPKFWGDNLLYIQYVNETITSEDLKGNQINNVTSKKLMVNESTLGLVEYNLQKEDLLSETWEEYIEEE
jgi:hypothetical protein